MTVASRSSLDVGEFLELLYWEVYSGISAGLQETGIGRALQITKVRVQFGSNPSADQPAAVDPAIDDPILPASAPWAIDVTMEPDRPTQIFEMTPAELVARAAGRGGSGAVGSLFDDFPVRAIQGVAEETSRFLGARGIDTVGQLAAVDNLSRFGSRRAQVLGFRTKARLARSPNPLLVPSPADPMSLYALAHRTPAELLGILGRESSSPARCRQLSAYLGILTVALDDDELERVPLACLVVGTGAR